MNPLNPISKTAKTGYQAARDALIPEAERYANRTVPFSADRRKYSSGWTRAFFGEMDRLARGKGIVAHDEGAYRAEAERRERAA